MRIITLILAALAGLAFAQPAAAQSLGDILGAVDSTRYDSCRYASGTYKTTCQIRRADRIVDVFERGNQRGRNEAATRLERRIALVSALKRACDAGDQHSCRRAEAGVSNDQILAARALMDACRTGDAFSCDRAEAVLMGVDRNYRSAPAQRTAAQASTRQQATPLSATQARIGNCIVDIDPETGMRTSGPYNCTR